MSGDKNEDFVRSLSRDDFYQMILTYTEKNYQYAIVDIIKENELSPDGFLDLTDAEMKEVFHRVGHRKTAQKLIHCIKAGTLSEPSKFQLQPVCY
jgi:hypothetical protein